ncbi:MAG: phytanoyl-CoA dioxygenase family protein [Candidatus Velthaea sp.]
MTTFWFALEDAGCLWVQPGGHRGPLRERFVADSGGLRIEPLDPLPWPAGDSAHALEVAAGTLVVLHGLLPHHSAANRSASSRHAYTLHAVDARAAYASTNWIQRPAAFPARGF